MKAFLVRHSHALADNDDSRRLLSAQGREITREVAGFLKLSGVLSSVHAVWHSPLARARETAELLIKELGLDGLLSKHLACCRRTILLPWQTGWTTPVTR